MPTILANIYFVSVFEGEKKTINFPATFPNKVACEQARTGASGSLKNARERIRAPIGPNPVEARSARLPNVNPANLQESQ